MEKIKLKNLGTGNNGLESFFIDDVLRAVKQRKKDKKLKKKDFKIKN